MPISLTTLIKQGELYFCEPDPQDTVGSEQEGDRPWVIVSIPELRRGRCVVGLPLSRHMEKAGAHLIKVPLQEITMDDKDDPNIDRVALTDQIRALDRLRFRRRLGHVSPRAVTSILLGLDYLFGNAPLPTTTPSQPAPTPAPI
jgi:mRNA-degrading endonuclease toxin of MazEF toxin-antitoxin module